MKQSTKFLLLILLGIGLTYLGVSGMIKDQSQEYINVSDSESDSSSIFYLFIGLLLVIIPLVKLIAEFRSQNVRKRY